MIERIYRIMLWLAPSEFRDRFGQEVIDTARALDADRTGRTVRARRVTRAIGDAAATTVVLRFGATGEQPSPPLPLRERIDAWLRDIQFALRGLRREPLLALFVITTLGLGIGANAALFGVADRLLLRGPDHVRDAAHVQRVYVTERPAARREFTSAGVGNVMLDIVRQSRLASGVAGYAENAATEGRGVDARPIQIGFVSASFFPLLGVQPAAGRFFSAGEDSPSAAEHVAVISHELWMREFAGSTDLDGRTVTLNDESFAVIGVAPRGFTGAELSTVDAWAPLDLLGPRITSGWQTSWNAEWLKIIVRIPDGVSSRALAAELTALLHAGYTGTEPARLGARVWIASLGADDAGTEPMNARVIRWLAGIALVVLLIAAANVINLLLARGVRRARDAAIRLALGATRARIVRLVLIESTLLAMGGAAFGLSLAAMIGGIARRSLLPDVAWTSSVVDVRVFAAATVVSLLIGLIVGLVPALGASRTGVAGALKSGVRDGGHQHSRLRATLTVTQAALSVTLLIGAGLFVRSLWNARAMRLGIDADRVLVVQPARSSLSRFAAGPGRNAERARRNASFVEAADRVRRIPGVEQAAVSVGLPFGNRFSVRLRVPGLDSIPRLKSGGPGLSAVSSDYFATVGTRITRGRGFTVGDHAGTDPVVIVSELMARTVWPGADPIGKCIVIGADTSPCARIVGIAEDTHQSELREDPTMHYYIPFGQEVGIGGTALIVRAAPTAAGIRESLRRAMVALDPGITYVAISTIQEQIDPQLQPWRLGAAVFVSSGLLALLVAAVGIYSVLSYLVANRRHEIGVRIALGAERGDIARLVMRGSVMMAIIGVLAGSIIALAASKFVQPLLFDVSARDPLVFGAVGGMLIAVAIAAALIPTVKANRIDPLEALRIE